MARIIIHRQQATAQYYTEDLGDEVGLDMISIPGDSFLMGTDDKEIERLCQTYDEEWFRNERPQHKVNVPTFFMGRYPITQAQWQIVAGWEQIAAQSRLSQQSLKSFLRRLLEQLNFKNDF